jgi:hypothetical protein
VTVTAVGGDQPAELCCCVRPSCFKHMHDATKMSVWGELKPGTHPLLPWRKKALPLLLTGSQSVDCTKLTSSSSGCVMPSGTPLRAWMVSFCRPFARQEKPARAGLFAVGDVELFQSSSGLLGCAQVVQLTLTWVSLHAVEASCLGGEEIYS